MAIHNPLEQFEIKKIINLNLLGTDVSFTNSALLMVISVLVIIILLSLTTKRMSMIPTRLQLMGEMIHELIDGMILDMTAQRRYFTPVFTLFIFVLFSNLLGMIPYSFTTTSHVIVTFALAIIVFIAVTILGFIKHGMHFLSLFLPSGTPMILAPLLIVIELFAYLARPISLSIRLTANMMAGHIIMKIIASFVIMAGYFGFIPFALLIVLQGFEMFVAVLQAYVFTILTCAYLNDAINLH